MPDLPDMVRVDSPAFGDDLLAYPQTIRGDLVTVRLELEDDHPAMQDVIADGFDPDQAEIMDIVHVANVRTMDGVPLGRTRAWMDEQERLKDEEFRRRLARARERGRVAMPELDAGLRSRQ